MQLLGDFEDSGREILKETERKKLMNECLYALVSLLKTLPAEYRAFVTSDSVTFLKKAKELDPRIFCVNGEIQYPVFSILGITSKSRIFI